jgi:hypothetical protein
MMDKNLSLPNLPAHIEETVRSLAQATTIITKTPRYMNGLWPVSRRCRPIRDSLAGWRSSLLRG